MSSKRFGIEFVEPEKPIDFRVLGKRQAMPVDHRVTAQHEAHRVRVGECELVGCRRSRYARYDGGHRPPVYY